MIIGSGSASFEILRYLAERLPILVTPRWVRTRSQPIAVDNVLHYLVRCLSVAETTGRTLEIGGADVRTYQELLQTMAEARGLGRRVIIPVPVLTPFLSALWIHLVTPVGARMARPLAEGLKTPVVVEDHTAEHLMPQRLLPARDAIAVALEAEARADVESTWAAAGPVPGDPDWAGGDVFVDARETIIPVAPSRVFEVLSRVGGRQGWFRYDSLWRLRGRLEARPTRSRSAVVGRGRRLLAGHRAGTRSPPDAASRNARAGGCRTRLRAHTGGIGHRRRRDPAHSNGEVPTEGAGRAALLVRRHPLPQRGLRWPAQRCERSGHRRRWR
jgi:hypothetical protein